MGQDKATPLHHINEAAQNVDVDACILGDTVYKAVPSIGLFANSCDGCAFTTDVGCKPEHCIKFACTPQQRADGRDVIWHEHTNHYTGHEVT